MIFQFWHCCSKRSKVMLQRLISEYALCWGRNSYEESNLLYIFSVDFFVYFY